MAFSRAQKRQAKFFVTAVAFFALLNVVAGQSLVFTKVDRKIDLQSATVRHYVTLKVENRGKDETEEVLLLQPSGQAQQLAFLRAAAVEGKGKARSLVPLTTSEAEIDGAPSNISFIHIKLHKPLAKGDTVNIEAYLVVTKQLEPFPTEITQSDSQLVLFHDSHYFLSPYPVVSQTTTVRLPSSRVESFTKLEPSKQSDTELKFGPYHDIPPLSTSPLTVHFENNRPFVVVEEAVREVEISHWGNVYVTENYRMKHVGAVHKGSFSRFDFQARPMASGVSAVRGLLARLPARAHSVYYRDEIGNISTSHLRSDLKKTELELEPRYPLLGGWSVSFIIGYSLPLEDCVFKTSDGRRALNMTFGSPFSELNVDKLVVKVVLPEGSKDVTAFTSFPADQSREVKYTYLDTVGRPVIVLSKTNVVPEYNALFFQVVYTFGGLALLAEPALLIGAFLAFFGACMAYVVDAVQRLQRVMAARTAAGDRLDKSLRELSRSGDTAAAKATRKAGEASLKASDKELKGIVDGLEACAKAPPVLAKVQALVAKERELQEKLIQKHSITVDGYERKLAPQDIDQRIAPVQARLTSLRAEVQALLLLLEE
eukprot:jgi/Mesen1/758/ME000110S_11027